MSAIHGRLLDMDIRQEIEHATNAQVTDIAPLSGGCIGQVYRVKLDNGRMLVAKVDANPQPKLDIEGFMLTYLAAHSQLPVPQVYFTTPRLLLMQYLPGNSHFSSAAQEDAAERLAALHAFSAPQFGLERDSLIGGLHQPNPWTDSWLEFFAQQRLIYMANAAVQAGRLSNHVLQRIQRFCEHLACWLEEPLCPALIHGDVWTTNVLAANGRITGFIDPAIYYADPEIELAFTTLFGTFGDAFFKRYQEIRPLRPGFFNTRRDIYNLYPLLVHVRLFGGSYVAAVEQTLRRFGY